jgi:hypothetical protein
LWDKNPCGSFTAYILPSLSLTSGFHFLACVRCSEDDLCVCMCADFSLHSVAAHSFPLCPAFANPKRL